MITHEDLVDAVCQCVDVWSCPSPSYAETCPLSKSCVECAENLVTEYENSLREEGKRLAIEKHIPKKIIYDEYGRDEGYPHCPNCNETLINDFVGVKYCPECGQKLDWTEGAEE